MLFFKTIQFSMSMFFWLNQPFGYKYVFLVKSTIVGYLMGNASYTCRNSILNNPV